MQTMDKFDQISLLFDAQQSFLAEARDCEKQAQEAKSGKYATILRRRAKHLQAQAQRAGAWKSKIEQR